MRESAFNREGDWDRSCRHSPILPKSRKEAKCRISKMPEKRCKANLVSFRKSEVERSSRSPRIVRIFNAADAGLWICRALRIASRPQQKPE